MEKYMKKIITLILFTIMMTAGIFTAQAQTKTTKVLIDTSMGQIEAELYPDKAPQTVENFIALANRGFYDGLTFHGIVKDFMIQGGDPQGTGEGSATLADLKDGGEDTAYTIKGEFIANGVDNDLKFDEGVIGMARNDYTSYSSSLTEESYNSGSSQFFIMTQPNTSLNGYYTAFGKVIEGMDIVHNIENVEVKVADDSEETGNTEQSTPVNPVKITSIRVDTQGVNYDLPETLTPFDYMSWMYQQYGIDPSSLSQ